MNWSNYDDWKGRAPDDEWMPDFEDPPSWRDDELTERRRDEG
jgi:hypothetical protein